MDNLLTVAILLELAGLVLLVTEIFIPSHGVISVAALGCLVGGIVQAFRYSQLAGVLSLLAMLVLLPIFAAVAIRLWPRTYFGRRVAPPNQPADITDSPAYSQFLSGLVGQTGQTITPLRPVGMCDFAGRRVECIAESDMIDRRIQVVAIAVQGQSLIVRPA